MVLVYFQFMFKQFEQCEGVGGVVSEIGNYFVVVQMMYFFYIVFYYGVVQCGLVIIGNNNMVVMVNIYNCSYEQIFWL